ncbi:MAG: ricin-type beta-trefoil lectin domain protein [Oligoflexus sp.]
MKALLNHNMMVALAALSFGLLACKPQSNVPPIASTQGLPQAGAIPQNDQNELIRQLEAERSASEGRAREIEAEIARLETLLTSSQEQNTQQQADLQAEIDRLKAEGEAEAGKIAELEAEQKKLQDDLDAAKKENEELKKQLENNNNNNVVNNGNNNNNQTTTVFQNRVIFFQSDCIDVVNASTADGANVVAYPCNLAANQRFDVEQVSTDSFRFVAKHSNKCLYVEGASTANGANIQQLSCRRNGDTSELFRFADTNGFDFKLQNVRSGKCLKIQANGNIVQDDCATSYTLFRWGAAS